jgi:hypothetical protein
MKLEHTETDLVGKWISAHGRIVGDEIENRIELLIKEHLRKIAVSPTAGAWETLYQDPSDGRYWELTYPQGEMQGGGPRRLTAIAAQAARAKYRLD